MERALENTVALVTDTGRVYCSGFISEGYILTAAHCVEGDVVVSVRNRGGITIVVRVASYNETQDVAALAPLAGRFGPGIPVAGTSPDYGDEVFVLGHSKGELEYSLTRGIVSHPRRLDGLSADMVWMQHDAGSVGGNSGGPVMDSRGRIVGLTSFGVLDGVYCAFGCPGVLTRTHISGAAHHESIVALLASLP